MNLPPVDLLEPAARFAAAPHPEPPAAQPEVVLVMASRFEDAQTVIEAVRRGRSVILNAAGLSPELGQRLVDYACGGITALDGQAHRIGESVFLLASTVARITAQAPAGAVANPAANSVAAAVARSVANSVASAVALDDEDDAEEGPAPPAAVPSVP
jgi:cell division inhibitor SepF